MTKRRENQEQAAAADVEEEMIDADQTEQEEQQVEWATKADLAALGDRLANQLVEQLFERFSNGNGNAIGTVLRTGSAGGAQPNSDNLQSFVNPLLAQQQSALPKLLNMPVYKGIKTFRFGQTVPTEYNFTAWLAVFETKFYTATGREVTDDDSAMHALSYFDGALLATVRNHLPGGSGGSGATYLQLKEVMASLGHGVKRDDMYLYAECMHSRLHQKPVNGELNTPSHVDDIVRLF